MKIRLKTQMLWQWLSAFLLLSLLYPFESSAQSSEVNIPSVIVLKKKSSQKKPTITEAMITKISNNQIKLSGANNLYELLSGKSGIQLLDTVGDGSQMRVSVRGFGENAAANSLILLNGIPLNNPDLGLPLTNQIILQTIDHVAITDGSEGVLLGDQAVGGVVQIVTRKPQAFAVKGDVAIGSYNHQIYEASIENRLSNGFSYLMDVQSDHNDNYRDHNQHKQKNFFGEFYFPQQWGATTIDYLVTDQDLDLAGALTAAQVAQNRRQSQNYFNFTSDTQQLLHLNHQQFLNGNWRIDADYAHQQFDGNGFIFSNFQQNRSVDNFNVTLLGTLPASQLLVGTMNQNASYQLSGTPFDTDNNQNREEFFIQWISFLFSPMKITLGTRYAVQHSNLHNTSVDFSKHDDVQVASMGISLPINHLWDWFIRRNGNFRFPKVDEQTFTPIENQGLAGQTGVSYETGWQFHTPRLNGALTLYQLNIQDEIAFDPTPSLLRPFGSNKNLDPTERRGILLESQWCIFDWWTLGGQYSYTSAHFQAMITKMRNTIIIIFMGFFKS